VKSRGAALLDVNLLVALFDPDHVHHQLAHDWFADRDSRAWATCAVTEMGFVRVVSQPAYASPISRVADLIHLLRRFCASRDHQFWPESMSLRDDKVFNPALVQGARQLTDVYLLALAVKMQGRLATFDRTIPHSAVAGAARETLLVISPDGEPGD
jgi:toxin-antitoxin system PIN domain toxin